jgi:hypothetical protein
MPFSDDVFLPPLLAPESGALLLHRLHESRLADDDRALGCRWDGEFPTGWCLAPAPVPAAFAVG